MSKHLLFSYGTLQLKKVQIETYGRILTGKKDTLSGYTMGKLKITNPEVLEKSDKDYHPILIPSNNTNDKIEGVIYEITDAELEETDLYEVDDYKRILATFDSGTKAWVYIENDNKKAR